MRLGISTNVRSNELEMQELLEVWLRSKSIRFIAEYYVPEVSRRPDFLLINDGLINIEAKTNPTKLFMQQMIDNAQYCNYTFALIPDFCLTPMWFKQDLIKNGFGLIVFNHKTEEFTEALEAHRNKCNNALKNKILKRLKNKS